MNIRLFSATVLAAVLSACAGKRTHYDTPDIPLPAGFQHTASLAEGAPQSARLKSVLPDWWRLLGNPELDRLVDRALANNHELRIASQRIVQAHARSEQARADRLPVWSIPYSASSAAPVEGVGLLPAGAELSARRTYQASVRAGWRPDLWGEVQAMYESADLQLWRAALARDDVQRALVANVVSAYASYLSLCDRLRLAEESEKLLSDLLASVRDRMNEGDATVIDFEQQRSAVFQVRATIPQLQLQRAQAGNRLASLLGTVPGELQLDTRGLDSLASPVVAPGLPSALLLRRPDVRTIEATMLAADANIDTARARMLPPLEISAQYGVGGFSFAQLLHPSKLFWNGLASLSATIFDGGRRAQDIAIARSVHEELTEAYAQALYNAVREVEDAQVAIASIGQRMALQEESVAAARKAWTFSRESYEAGAIDYMVLLDTERSYHARLDEFNRIRLESALALVDLFQALGGGVETDGVLPGAGRRPAAPPDIAFGLVQAVIPPSGKPMTLAPEPIPDSGARRWVAQLPGAASPASAGAMRRDLQARFAAELAGTLRVQVRREVSQPGTLYRVFVGPFADQAAARQFCAALRTRFARCQPAELSPTLATGAK